LIAQKKHLIKEVLGDGSVFFFAENDVRHALAPFESAAGRRESRIPQNLS
jgi:hypothetical protein